jgi:alpha-ketoglutarate-dependent 2,4-dichlorophenoxyacetate dioxygenase
MPHALRGVDIEMPGVVFHPNEAGQPPALEERNAMTVTIRQLGKHFFGEVSGVDLRQPLTPQEARDIEAGMDKYAVLLFRGQDITDAQQMAFALNFGERENPRGGNVVKPHESRLASTGLNDVSNLDRDGKPLPRDSRAHLFNLGNCLWHSDSSFRPIPAKFSLLSARVVNPKGGNTEFADMRAAYDALDDETKAEIEDMICEHSLMYSRGSLGFLDYTDEEKEMFKPVRQRLVRTHPVHGRKSLYLSSHAGAILGMSVPEARLLLRDLTEHATQPEFVHVHKWTVHDLIMWDNRQTMHRVRRYDQSQPRDMRRATVAGTQPTVAQQAAE